MMEEGPHLFTVNTDFLSSIVHPRAASLAESGSNCARSDCPVRRMSNPTKIGQEELFQEIHTQTGAQNVRQPHLKTSVPWCHQFYNQHCSPADRWMRGQHFLGNSGQTVGHMLMETAFLSTSRHLTGWPRYECTELLDALDCSRTGGVGYGEFFLLVVLCCSKTSMQRQQVLYMHGKAMHKVFCRATPTRRQWQSLRICGLLLGVSPRLLADTMREAGADRRQPLSLQEFQLVFYLALQASAADAHSGKPVVPIAGAKVATPPGKLGRPLPPKSASAGGVLRHIKAEELDSGSALGAYSTATEQHRCGCVVQ